MNAHRNCPYCNQPAEASKREDGYLYYNSHGVFRSNQPVTCMGAGTRVPDEEFAGLLPLSDPGNAEFFAIRHGAKVRFDADRGTWLLFDGVRWAPDALDKVKLLAVEALRQRAYEAVQEPDAETRKGKLNKLFAAENRVPSILTAAEPYLGTRTVEWDSDPWLLGVPNGVVDLRTGELRSATREDRITMQTAVPFDPEAKCPLWEKTLGEIFGSSPGEPNSTVDYIQRALGYSITGDCREEIFFLCTSAIDACPPGREGKGTVISTVSYVLGDYAEVLGFHSLEARKEEGGTSPDLAKLVHKRFVSASETSGGRFNEARIKRMTGRDPIAACFKYENEFTYIPEFKLWLAVNQLPKVRDEAFWSRPHRIPFEVSFAGREDKTLKDRLREEAPGILAWLVRGALAWQKGGLAPIKKIRAAVEEYRLSQEPLSDFYEVHCVFDDGLWTPVDELRGAYFRWCQVENIHFRLGPKRFSQELAKRFKEHRETTGAKRRGYLGIGLQASVIGNAGQDFFLDEATA